MADETKFLACNVRTHEWAQAPLSDEISRDVHDKADEAGWFHTELNLDTTYKHLLRAATNMDFAHEPSASSSGGR